MEPDGRETGTRYDSAGRKTERRSRHHLAAVRIAGR
ncbi:hypothetical protein ACM36E_001746 [Cronobacter sakazakii]